MARRERLLAALVLNVTVLWLSGGPGRAAALIEPRLDRPRWWVPPSNPGDSHRFPAEPKVAQHRPQKDEPAREDVLPAYIVSEHTVGPKPPPGYSFSAGPKPARFPKPAQQDEEEGEEEEDEDGEAREEEASPAPPPPTTPEVTVVDNSLKHLWPKSGRRYGGARPRSGSR
ncbi:hypothetical protein FJT64_015876 [Amphibalanus amphitrite]|uniref:Uncharacterized protein n=1 Tax=Amphibalanus amphitrite TaxID=1232801 RepID=A0A6A4XG36_AMPAM|nr:hypothetical protein FJT64_015876 [Amphibalanus amphitrite]